MWRGDGHGLASVDAGVRTIADTAGLGQGLIFSHYGSVNGLLEGTPVAQQLWDHANPHRLADAADLAALERVAGDQTVLASGDRDPCVAAAALGIAIADTPKRGRQRPTLRVVQMDR